mgnify:FL=1
MAALKKVRKFKFGEERKWKNETSDTTLMTFDTWTPGQRYNMGTRGAYGFRLNEKDYVSYNQFDSYLEELGERVLEQTKDLLKRYGLGGLKERVLKIKLVIDETPTQEDITRLKPYTDFGKSEGKRSDWYCLTRKMQGDLSLHLNSGYMIDAAGFLLNSLFCEYAYITNLDEEVLEVYKGLIKEVGTGRYDSKESEEKGYFGVKLMIAYPLKKIRRLKSLAAFYNTLVRKEEWNP